MLRSLRRPRRRSGAAARASAAGAAALLAGAAGCSLLVGFPEEVAQGGGGSGGGNVGGASTCEDHPSALVHLGAPTPDDVVFVSGLAATSSDVYAFGLSSSGIAGLNLPIGASSQLFVAGFGAAGDGLHAVLSASNCDPAVAANRPVSGRVTTRADGSLVISGGLAAGGMPMEAASWGLGPGSDDACLSDPVSVQSSAGGGFVPFFALVTDLDANDTLLTELADGADGQTLDIDRRTPSGVGDGRVAGIGVGQGPLFFNGPTAASSVYFLRRSHDLQADDETVLLPTQYTNVYDLPYAVAGGVAVDDAGTVWFGGGSCAAAGGCDPQAFVGRWAEGAATPTVLAERPGTTSAVAAVAEAGGVVLFGGRYQDTPLALLGATLPAPDLSDPFVLAVDAASDEALWSWPTAGAAIDRGGWNAVSDVVTASDDGCGAVVYVVGCTTPAAPSQLDCKMPEPGKTGFVVKLDRKTGAELWRAEVALEDPVGDMFVPLALASEGGSVYLAAAVHGALDLSDLHLPKRAEPEALIVRLAP